MLGICGPAGMRGLRAAGMAAPPAVSKVLHIRRVPHDATEADVRRFCAVPPGSGALVTVVLWPTMGGSALVQYDSVEGAAALLARYEMQGSPPLMVTAGGRRQAEVILQYSRHQQLDRQQQHHGANRSDPSSGSPAAASGGSPVAASQRVLLITLRNSAQQYRPITIEYLHELLSQYGKVERIVISAKHNASPARGSAAAPASHLQVLCQVREPSEFPVQLAGTALQKVPRWCSVSTEHSINM